MVTKWNNTSEKQKGFLSLTAFILGASLLAGSVLGAGKLALQTCKNVEWWRSDWQETTEFKREMSWYLNTFLEFGAGEDLDWYDMNQMKEKEPLLPGSTSIGFPAYAAETAAEIAAPIATLTVEKAEKKLERDAAFQKDSNVLYSITSNSANNYTNASTLDVYWGNLPKEYNLYLFYQNGQVILQKNGEKVDIYGDGIYDSAEQWYVPGYDNFKAGEDMPESLRVRIAVRQTPIQLYGDGYSQSSRMYSLYAEYQLYRETAMRLAVMLLAGIVLLFLAHRLRDYRGLANRAIAKVTNYIGTELRALLLVGFGAYHIFLMEGIYWLDDIIYLVFTEGEHLAILTGLLLVLWPTTPLFFLGWTLWLIHNDHRYNPPEKRRGLLHALRAKDLKLPIQKRLQQISVGALLSMTVLVAATVPLIWYAMDDIMYGWIRGWAILVVLILWDLLFLYLIYSAWKSLRAAKDIGLLADQITAIHNGDLTTSLALPKDADLCRAAEELNDIQTGLDKALQERTQSERMKVELISNVSHDLKTPLTSVLSYAVLLEEEDLPGAAGDYARIILEKAKRLDTMVQDVFSISKAASGQLKLTPERLDLGKLLRQTLADMEDAIDKSGLTMKISIPDESVEIVSDGTRLYRVFQNLIQNALQYSLPGSRVYLTLRAEGECATATIRNTSAQEIPAGVDFTARFVRGDESRTDGGTGLGLSIAKSFTESCGGSFEVETLADLFTAKVILPLDGCPCLFLPSIVK